MSLANYSLQPWLRDFHVARVAPQWVSATSPIHFAAIFGWTMSAVSAAMCLLVRGPLDGPHWSVFLKAFLLLGAVISCATLLTAWRVERGGSYTPVLISTLTVIFLPCLTWVNRIAADIITYPVLLGLFAIGITQAISAERQERCRKSRPAILCGCLAGVGYFLLVNGMGYASVLTPELALTGLLHIDTLFHASIANMLIEHGVSSTGADGFIPIKYHVLSHIWFGCLGRWLGATTLESYYIGAQVICIPMLLFSLSLATYLLPAGGRRFSNGALATLFPLLLLFIVDYRNFLSYLISESYLLSLIILLLSLPLLAELADPQQQQHVRMRVLALAAAAILIAISKISVGVVFWSAFGFLLWRRLGLAVAPLFKLGAPIILLVLVLGNVFQGNTLALNPGIFFRNYPESAWPNLAINLVLLCVAALVWRSGTPRDRRCAEAFAVIAISCTIPSVILDIPGSSAHYFINIGTWGAIVLIAAYAGPHLEERQPNFFKPSLVLSAILLLAYATDEKRNSAVGFGEELARIQNRLPMLTGSGPGAAPTTRQRLFTLLVPGHPARHTLASDVKRSPGAQSVQTLLAMGATREPGAAVFVPPENQIFWRFYRRCAATPFFIAAELGIPLLRGINPVASKCPREPAYGFAAYGPDSVSQESSDTELCARAASSGVSTVFILSQPTVGRKIDCNSL